MSNIMIIIKHDKLMTISWIVNDKLMKIIKHDKLMTNSLNYQTWQINVKSKNIMTQCQVNGNKKMAK